MAIGFIFLLLLYSALHVYLARRVAWWVQKVLLQRVLLPWKWLCFCVPCALLALSFPVGFFLPPTHSVTRMIRVVGYHWLGFFLYFLLALVLVDLILSGHTHGGQLFPVNLLTDRMFLLDAGYERFGDTHAVVSTGVGFWGPPLRVGSDCELVVLPLLFTET